MLNFVYSSRDHFIRWVKDFLGGPEVKTLPSNAGGVGSIPGQRSHMPQGPNTKTKNRSSTVTNSIKTKNGPQQKKKKS